MANFEVTISIPSTIRMTVGKDGRLENIVNIDKMPIETIQFAVVNGFLSALSDVSRPKDENGKALDDAAWQAARDKRALPWKQGLWAAKAGQRGEQFVTHMRNAFVAEQVAKGKTVKEIDALISARVKALFGKDEKATFDRFLDATATLIAKEANVDYQDARAKLETKYETLAREALAAAEKVVDAIDISDIDLTDFAV